MALKLKIIGYSLVLGVLCGCSQQPEEIEPDYESMVMQDDENEGREWIPEVDRDRKVIAQDLPDPDEMMIVEPFEEDHGFFSEAP